MNEEEIRTIIREGLRKCILPRNLPIGISSEPGQLVEGYSLACPEGFEPPTLRSEV
jgi:hypothetical protein